MSVFSLRKGASHERDELGVTQKLFSDVLLAGGSRKARLQDGFKAQEGDRDVAEILLAEDDEAVREFVSRALSYYGHQVTAVPDGGAALEALEKSPYDLMLTDIVMPGLDGIALALKATKVRPDMPVLMMTGFASERQRAHNLDALIDRVIAKPFSLKEICSAVDDALSHRQRVA
ncbi:MAG TPA: response regulator [Terriglobia bacterium]|nr:response regulator [Terriglobia bacterium]